MPNALAAEKSPYLLQHADNPVNWMPWGEEAFAKARAEQKPIFLSIGYSTCHWCHVMAHESFENAEIAALLNANFVPVKVDREERPDVDKVYMSYVQALTGHGGWPLSAWLMPGLQPFYGGTYFTPEDRGGRPGFATVLASLAKAWTEDRAMLETESERVLAHLREEMAAQTATPSEDLVDAAGHAFEGAFQYFYENYDATNGGFGGAPKFPRPVALEFLFRCAVLQGADSDAGKAAIDMAAETLRRMAGGGIHDHVGGGFHRYSVDESWHVPHFEKMLYDQAQVATAALDAFLATDVEAYAWLARDIFDYVLRDLRHPGGGFYSAEDADSVDAAAGGRKTEGAFYAWTRAEIEHALGDDAAFFCSHFGVETVGNVPPALDPHGELAGKNVLIQRRPILETASEHYLPVELAVEKLAGLLERLRAVRALRPRPHLDDKIITSWNGLMISALAKGAQSCAAGLADKREFYREAAIAAAEFVLRELHDEGSGVLYRNFRDGRGATEGFAEDYAFFIAALLDLHELTLDVRWLMRAERLQAVMDEKFLDQEGGGYFSAPAGDASILLRMKDDYDGAEPTACSVAADNLLRLAAMGWPELHDRALGVFAALRSRWEKIPQALPALLCAMERALTETVRVVIVGDPAGGGVQELLTVCREKAGPRRVVVGADGGRGQDWLMKRLPELAAMKPGATGAAAYVCTSAGCLQPVFTPGELRGLLAGLTDRG